MTQTASQTVSTGSQAALSAALSLADRGVALAISSAASIDRTHHIVERLQVGVFSASLCHRSALTPHVVLVAQTLDAGYGVTGKVVQAAEKLQGVASGLDQKLGVLNKAQVGFFF